MKQTTMRMLWILGMLALAAMSAWGAEESFADSIAEAKQDWKLVQIAGRALEAEDFPMAEAAYRKALTLISAANANPTARFGAAEMALLRGDKATAQADLQGVIDHPKIPVGQRYVARVLQLAIVSTDVPSFRRQIAQADTEFAAEKFTPEQRFKCLREAASHLFTANRYDDVRALEAETGAMLQPEVQKTFTCRYAAGAPRSADSWAQSPLLKQARYREARFEPYVNLDDALTSDVAKLKGAASATAPNKAGYDTSIYLVYDERGVHLYVDCADPDARAIDQGLISGGGLELYLQPGKDAAYHQWFFELPGTDDPHQVNWDTPHPHYRYTYDYLVKDTVVTDRGIGAYTFIPWEMVYDKLPSESNRWRFSMQRYSKGGAVTLGGAVHELGRAVELHFDMTRAQRLAIMRNIAGRAFAKYQNTRNRRDGLALWNDPELGDPAFYASDLLPLLARLDAAGARVNEKLSDVELEQLYATVVPEWMEVSYHVAEMRAAYLKTRLFAAPAQP